MNQRPCLGHHERSAPRYSNERCLLDLWSSRTQDLQELILQWVWIFSIFYPHGLKISRNWYSSEYGSSRSFILTDSRSPGTDIPVSDDRRHRLREVQRMYIVDYRFVAQSSLFFALPAILLKTHLSDFASRHLIGGAFASQHLIGGASMAWYSRALIG